MSTIQQPYMMAAKPAASTSAAWKAENEKNKAAKAALNTAQDVVTKLLNNPEKNPGVEIAQAVLNGISAQFSTETIKGTGVPSLDGKKNVVRPKAFSTETFNSVFTNNLPKPDANGNNIWSPLDLESDLFKKHLMPAIKAIFPKTNAIDTIARAVVGANNTYEAAQAAYNEKLKTTQTQQTNDNAKLEQAQANAAAINAENKTLRALIDVGMPSHRAGQAFITAFVNLTLSKVDDKDVMDFKNFNPTTVKNAADAVVGKWAKFKNILKNPPVETEMNAFKDMAKIFFRRAGTSEADQELMQQQFDRIFNFAGI
jgi:hypothetical protein